MININYARYEEIKEKIVNIFEFYNISSLPILSFVLASKMGIELIPYSQINNNKRYLLYKKSDDGFSVEKTTGKWFIYYNDNKSLNRINYTLMHEIGHKVLDHTEDSELAEKEVNFFAKFALAPPVLIQKYNLADIREISKLFCISKEAASYAYQYYNKWKTNNLKNGYKKYELKLLTLFDSHNQPTYFYEGLNASIKESKDFDSSIICDQNIFCSSNINHTTSDKDIIYGK